MNQTKSNETAGNHLLEVSQHIANTTDSIRLSKKQCTDRLEKIFESAKKTIVRGLEKSLKKLSNDINIQFDSLIHGLDNFSKEVATQRHINLLRLSGIARYANKLSGECKRLQNQADKIDEKVEKLCETVTSEVKSFDCSRKVDIEFNENCSLALRKNVQFGMDVAGLCYVRDKLLVFGEEFYKLEGREQQTCLNSLRVLRPVKISSQECILRVHEDFLVVSTNKEARLMKVEGDFSSAFNAVQIEDTVFIVATDCVYKFSLHTGQLSYHKIQGGATHCASDNFRGMLAVGVGKELRLYNCQVQCVYSKLLACEHVGLAVAGKYIVLWSDTLLVLLQGLEVSLKRQLHSIRGVCQLNKGELFVLSSPPIILSLLTLQTAPAGFKHPCKRLPVMCVSNRCEMHVLYENNTVKEFAIE